MNDNECTAKADLILNILFHTSNKDKTKEELIQEIKPVIRDIFESGKNLGRRQILNHLQGEIDNLKDNS